MRFFCGQPDVSTPSSVSSGGSFSCAVHACNTGQTNAVCASRGFDVQERAMPSRSFRLAQAQQ